MIKRRVTLLVILLLIVVLRTGIEPHMTISKLPYLQAVLQAVQGDLYKIYIY